MTPQDFAKAVLEGVGAPVTQANIAAVVGWQHAEGGAWGNSAAYNPLNTTQPAQGARSINSVGVKAYTSWPQGISATIATLKNGNYGGILSSFHANDPSAVAHAIGSSPWGTNASTVSQTIAAAAGTRYSTAPYTPPASSPSAPSSSTGANADTYGGLGGFLLKALLTIGLLLAGLLIAGTGVRSSLSGSRS